MKVPTVRLVFDRKKVADDYKDANRSRKGLVQIEIYHNGSRRWISTGVKLFKGQWHDVRGVVNHPDSAVLNSTLRALISRANDNIREQIDDGNVSVSSLSLKETDTSIFSIIDDYIQSRLERGAKDKSMKVYRIIETHLRHYNKIKTISDISRNTIEGFASYLLHDRTESSAMTYLRTLKTICNEMVDKKVIRSNPFTGIKLSAPRNDKVRYLRDYELEKVKAYVPEDNTERLAKDLFLFQAMTGMSYIDAVKVSLASIEEFKGKKIIRAERQKTGEGFAIALLTPALEILERNPEGFKKRNYGTITKALHIIGLKTLGFKLTTHMARHTFATWALSNNVSIEHVSKMLGHSKIQTTQRYAKILAEDVINEFDKLEDALKK